MITNYLLLLWSRCSASWPAPERSEFGSG